MSKNQLFLIPELAMASLRLHYGIFIVLLLRYSYKVFSACALDSCAQTSQPDSCAQESLVKIVKAKTWVKLREFSTTLTKDDFKLVEEDLPELKDGGRVVLFLFHKLLTNSCQDIMLRTLKLVHYVTRNGIKFH